MNARPATFGDFRRIVDMARTFWEFTGYDVVFDADSVADTAHACMIQGLLIVLEHEGAVIGFVAGIASPCIANANVRMGCELAWWIEPEHRNAGAGSILLRAIENAAREAGIKYWSMVSLQNSGAEVEALYSKFGYERSESTFTKVLR